MKILALEFSTEHRSVALGQARVTEIGGRRVVGLVEEVLRQAGCEREEVETIAVGLGPGSYTGIRSAIAFAQGWQLGRPIRTIGVSSVECLAAQAQAQKIWGQVNIVIDAQRNEFYLASYQIDADSRRLLEPLRLASPAEIAARQNRVGPEQAIALYPNAVVLGQLAAGPSASDALEPIYLRETSFKKAPPPRFIL